MQVDISAIGSTYPLSVYLGVLPCCTCGYLHQQVHITFILTHSTLGSFVVTLLWLL